MNIKTFIFRGRQNDSRKFPCVKLNLLSRARYFLHQIEFFCWTRNKDIIKHSKSAAACNIWKLFSSFFLTRRVLTVIYAPSFAETNFLLFSIITLIPPPTHWQGRKISQKTSKKKNFLCWTFFSLDLSPFVCPQNVALFLLLHFLTFFIRPFFHRRRVSLSFHNVLKSSGGWRIVVKFINNLMMINLHFFFHLNLSWHSKLCWKKIVVDESHEFSSSSRIF